MRIEKTNIEGLLLIELKQYNDDRGFFVERYNKKIFNELGLNLDFVQDNHSRSKISVLRGLHYQTDPHQGKLVGVLRGKIFDVVVDLRKDSSTFLQWFGTELSPANNYAHVIPEGCAHGFQVLEQGSELLYLHTAAYTPASEAAIRFDDPMIGITWPLAPTEISQRDTSHPYLDKAFKGIAV